MKLIDIGYSIEFLFFKLFSSSTLFQNGHTYPCRKKQGCDFPTQMFCSSVIFSRKIRGINSFPGLK